MMIDNDGEDYDEDYDEEKAESENHDVLLEILAELETSIASMNFLDELTDSKGDISEENKEKFEKWRESHIRKFDPDNYKKNTVDEDNFEKPKRDEVRAMYKGVDKPAVIWKLKKDRSDIKTAIGGDYEKIPYRKDIFIVADKEREEKDLDPNIVLYDEIIKGDFLIIKDVSGRMESLVPKTILEIKDDMFTRRVRYVDENYNEIPKEEFDER